jgi:mevalonate kinase
VLRRARTAPPATLVPKICSTLLQCRVLVLHEWHQFARKERSVCVCVHFIMSEYVDEQHEAAVDDILDAQAMQVQHERIGARVLAHSRAFGKLILLGEHFVVYHVPALVGAISDYTNCEVVVTDTTTTAAAAAAPSKDTEPLKPGISIVDHRPAVPLYKTQKAEEGKEAVSLVFEHLQIDVTSKYHVQCIFGGTLTCVSGIGASAAQVVSLARALSSYESRALSQPLLPQRLSDDAINRAGYEGEKGYHGTPSGIDNTAATFGGLLKFQRVVDDPNPIFTKFAIASPIRIVYASTGITASTSAVVNDVRAKKEADPAWFAALLEQYTALCTKAETAILNADMVVLGDCLDQNHALLQQLTVSCPECDALVEAARAAGALGAKLSGTGRGGLVLALTPTLELSTAVAAALTAIVGAHNVWQTTLA